MHAKTTGRKKSERYISKCRKRLLFVALPVFAALALATIIAALICGLGKLYPEEFPDNVLGPASAGILVALSALFTVTAVLLRFAQANEDAKAYDLTPYSAGEREKYDSVTTFRSYYAPDLFESDGTVELKGLQNFINYVLDMAPRLLEDADAPEKPYPADFEPVFGVPETDENAEFELTKRTEGDVTELVSKIKCGICFGPDGLRAGENVLGYDRLLAACRIFFRWRTVAVVVLFFKTPEDFCAPIAKFRLDGRILGILRKHGVPLTNEPLVVKAESDLKKTFRSHALMPER